MISAEGNMSHSRGFLFFDGSQRRQHVQHGAIMPTDATRLKHDVLNQRIKALHARHGVTRQTMSPRIPASEKFYLAQSKASMSPI